MKRDYRERFQRSLGIVTELQLERIKNTTVAIGGLGLGGAVFLNLVRMGFEKFHVADPDIFERTNINRQRMARETTIGRRKDECSVEEAQSINPDVQVVRFPEGVKPHNIEKFLEGVDWVVDVVDIFAMPDKLLLHSEARKKNIPVASCAALGLAGSVVVFDSKTPSFAELTGMKPEDHFNENVKKFIRFICPEVPEYMRDQFIQSLDRSTHVPFINPGVEMAAASCASEILKNIIGFGERIFAPRGLFFDTYKNQVEIFEANYKMRPLPSLHKKAA